MTKNLNASKRFTKVANKSHNAVAQFQTTIDTLESSNLELNMLWSEVDEEITRLLDIQEAAANRISTNNTTIQGLKNVLEGN